MVSQIYFTRSFTLSFNEQADGSVLFVAFSLTGDVVEPGSGPIAAITYQSVTPYESTVSLNVVETIINYKKIIALATPPHR